MCATQLPSVGLDGFMFLICTMYLRLFCWGQNQLCTWEGWLMPTMFRVVWLWSVESFTLVSLRRRECCHLNSSGLKLLHSDAHKYKSLSSSRDWQLKQRQVPWNLKVHRLESDLRPLEALPCVLQFANSHLKYWTNKKHFRCTMQLFLFVCHPEWLLSYHNCTLYNDIPTSLLLCSLSVISLHCSRTLCCFKSN